MRPTASFRSSLEYAGLVYGKAPYLYVRLEERFGAEALMKAIRAAVGEHSFRLATPESWAAALERELC